MKIGGVIIEPSIMNAACSMAKTIQDIRALAATPIGAITVGSITLEPRTGNPEPRWHVEAGYALNSFGMPNQGAAFYRKNLPTMIHIAHAANKKLSVSIAGFSTDEYVKLAKLVDTAGADLLELNLGCPNITVDGKQKSIVSFDKAMIHEIVQAVSQVTDMPVLLKLSPYSNPAELQAVAKTIIASGKVSAVVLSNTFANSTAFANAAPVIADQLGGLSGKALMPISLGQVWQFKKILPDTIAIIGVGGIESASDVRQYMQAGADGVQAATLIMRNGHAALAKLVV